VIFVIRAVNLNNFARSYKIQILYCGGLWHNCFWVEKFLMGKMKNYNSAMLVYQHCSLTEEIKIVVE